MEIQIKLPAIREDRARAMPRTVGCRVAERWQRDYTPSIRNKLTAMTEKDSL